MLTFVAILIVAANGPASQRPYLLPDDIAGKTVLYVGAHPDDEWGFAPILAEACIERAAHCQFIVAADANSYGCLLTIGLRDARECSRRRRVEMRAAVAIFGGKVQFLGNDDLFYAFDDKGRNRTISEWSAKEGSHEALVRRFEVAIRRVKPRLLFTFDPRHGSSCHAGHRATARLAIEAVKRLPAAERPEIWLEQTSELDEHGPEAAKTIEQGGYFGWPGTASETQWYDANRRLPKGRTAFDYVVEDRKKHATQMPDEASGRRVLNPSASTRFVPISRLSADVDTDLCAPLKLRRPTLDTEFGREFFNKLMRGEKPN